MSHALLSPRRAPRNIGHPTAVAMVLLTLALLVSSLSWARYPRRADVRPWVLEHTSHGDSAEFLVVLRDTANLAPAARLRSRIARGRFVHSRLVETARRSQASLRSWLDRRGIHHRDFYIVNALLVRGDRQLVEEIARRPEVARIEGNPRIQVDLPEPSPPVTRTSAGGAAGVEWNIEATRAPELWAKGFTGQGVVIGSQDTGVDWTHPALIAAYRGWDGATAHHDYNWHDAIHANGGPCGNDSPEPCDPFGHGTHTVGIMIGNDGAGTVIGMAPGARWIACRNMDVTGAGSPATYLECFQFFLAPYPIGGDPEDGNPDMAPDITNNSWTCPPSEGCSVETLEAAVSAQRAAGILTVAAAGNGGPGCGTIVDPPAVYPAVLTVGATNFDGSLATFSSRGPAPLHPAVPPIVKPDLVAPGSHILSSVPGGGYTTMSGTSMASPGVAGGAALLLSAFPTLRRHPIEVVHLLETSARRLTGTIENCGGGYVFGPNDSWGYGLLDVEAAYEAGRASAGGPVVRRPGPRVTAAGSSGIER